MNDIDLILQRMRAIDAVVPVLQGNNAVALQRAVGRPLNIGPSEMFLFLVLKLCVEYCHGDEVESIFDREIDNIAFQTLLSEIGKVTEKLRPGHMEMFALVVANLPFQNVARLYCYSKPTDLTQLDDTYLPSDLVSKIKFNAVEQSALLTFLSKHLEGAMKVDNSQASFQSVGFAIQNFLLPWCEMAPSLPVGVKNVFEGGTGNEVKLKESIEVLLKDSSVDQADMVDLWSLFAAHKKFVSIDQDSEECSTDSDLLEICGNVVQNLFAVRSKSMLVSGKLELIGIRLSSLLSKIDYLLQHIAFASISFNPLLERTVSELYQEACVDAAVDCSESKELMASLEGIQFTPHCTVMQLLLDNIMIMQTLQACNQLVYRNQSNATINFSELGAYLKTKYYIFVLGVQDQVSIQMSKPSTNCKLQVFFADGHQVEGVQVIDSLLLRLIDIKYEDDKEERNKWNIVLLEILRLWFYPSQISKWMQVALHHHSQSLMLRTFATTNLLSSPPNGVEQSTTNMYKISLELVIKIAQRLQESHDAWRLLEFILVDLFAVVSVGCIDEDKCSYHEVLELIRNSAKLTTADTPLVSFIVPCPWSSLLLLMRLFLYS